MILMTSAAVLAAAGADASNLVQPLQGFIVCPGDPRCPTGTQKPPQGFIICPGDRRCPPGVAPPPIVSVCPNGMSVPDGLPCPAISVTPQVVFFEWGESQLSDSARALMSQIVDDYRTGGSLQVRLEGHTDRSEPDNIRLSEQRAASVRDYLLAMGVLPSAITTTGWGETRPMVETEDGTREPQNRRVQIIFGDGAK